MRGRQIGSLFGLVARAGVPARAACQEWGALLGPWTVTAADSDDAVRYACTHMETAPGWRSLGGYVETATGFALLTPPPYLLVVHCPPKRAMEGDDTNRLCGTLERHLPRHGGRPPQQWGSAGSRGPSDPGQCRRSCRKHRWSPPILLVSVVG